MTLFVVLSADAVCVVICRKWMLYYRVKKEGLYVF